MSTHSQRRGRCAEGLFPAGDAAGGKSRCPLPKNDVGAEVEGPFNSVILLVQAWRIEVIVAHLRRRLETETLARIPVEAQHLVDMIVGYGVLIGGDLDPVRIDFGKILNLVVTEAAVCTGGKVPRLPTGTVCKRQGIRYDRSQVRVAVHPAVGRFLKDVGIEIIHARTSKAACVGQ